MRYFLRLYDADVLCFELEEAFDGTAARVIEVINQPLLPLDMVPTDEGLLRWLKRRTLPSNRAYVHSLLAKQGLSTKNVRGIIDLSMGLSLNDAYWVVANGFLGRFEQYNLYSNKFNRAIGELAFTGYGSNMRRSFISSPEFTTNGMLAKCWRRLNGKVILFKSGTEGFANAGQEPYSEFYASQIAEAMALFAVQYNLSKWKGRLCSTCALFTDINTGFIPIGALVREGGMRAVMSYYQALGSQAYDQLVDMLVFDAVICNTDRHFGNFGLLLENHTNRILGAAPIFDNGLSLFCHAMADDLANLNQYAETCQPATYPDHLALAGTIITKRQRDKLRPLLTFSFQKHPRYNLPDQRLRAIEDFIRARTRVLLG